MHRLLLLAAVVFVVAAPANAAKAPPTNDQVAYHGWTSTTDFTSGTASGATAANGALTFGSATGTLAYDDPFDSSTTPIAFDTASWTSPWQSLGFGATQVVTSWTANTPHGTWIQIELRGITTAGTTTKWYVTGQWTSQMPSDAAGDIHRTSLGGQADADGTVAIDTFIAAKGVAVSSYQVRVTLLRRSGGSGGPTVRSVGAI